MSKSLVAYFSASGTTKSLAEDLANHIGCDLYEIKPTVRYEKKDLNWLNPLSRSSVEMRKRIHPEIIKGDIDITAYDTVYIGFPIWWYIAPTIINSFLESLDFSGKKIVLFATSGGSGFGKAVEELKPSAPKAVIVESTVLNKNYTDSDLDKIANA
ncbi:MAG: flavodoxin [Clostridia bacterium]|nr:flavodoxin [Clostridia bacterium]